MFSFISLSASIRITLFLFEMIVSAIFLFCIVYGIWGKKNKLYLSYLISLFASLIVIIVTRTPVLIYQNNAIYYYLNFILFLPSVIGIILFLKTKKIIYLIDSIMCIFNVPIFEFIPYYAYIVSAMFVYVVIRCFISLFDNLEYIKKYPGRLAIKSAFDGLNDGIAFINSFGQIIYINKSLKTTLGLLNISSHTKAEKIKQNILQVSQKNGRTVSENSCIINIKNNFYKFTFDNQLSQISCIDISQEETLIKQSEHNKLLLKKTNIELNKSLSQIDKIEKEQQLLSIKGHIHDNLAQQLSILHMFILNDNSNDLSKIKTMLSNLDITPNEKYPEDYFENLSNLFKMIGVKLYINGKIPSTPEQKKFAYKLIKEASTNAIKHGKATKIQVNILENQENLQISISNNGTLPKNITFGNGLNSIQTEIAKLGGTLNIATKKQFSINISIKK